MDYREKLNASQEKAHLRIIATKIDREMRELRSQAETSPTARRRWVWELIQNAKDVRHDDGVRIQINYDTSKAVLVFRHSGKPFTADNIRFLIEQISTKERNKDESGLRINTGKFGTGFLATHLLSETVTVHGIAKEPDLEFKQFQFDLDRSGTDLDAITSAVERAKQSVQNLDELPAYLSYDPLKPNTTFMYPLADPLAHRVVSDGIADLNNCLPYALVNEPAINWVDLPSQGKRYRVVSSSIIPDTAITLSDVLTEPESDEHVPRIVSLATLKRGFTTISIPVQVVDGTFHIQPLADTTPRLFCDFPLVGTEGFPFPAIINNPHFDPTDPRDGVLLTGTSRITPDVENNRRILAEAVSLFAELLQYAVSSEWKDLHNLANISSLRESYRWVTHDWFNENILSPVRRQLALAPIVSTADGGPAKAMLKDDSSASVWFPSGSRKDVRAQIWKLANLVFPHAIPKEDEVELWHHLIWDKCAHLTPDRFAEYVEHLGSKDKLSAKLKGLDCDAWLNDLYSVIRQDEQHADSILNQRAIFPNQLGIFTRLASLYKDGGGINEEFKDILELLGHDIRGLLADQQISVDIPAERTLNLNYAVERISSLALDKCNDRETAKACREPFGRILKWFRENPQDAVRLFHALYSQKHLLYDDESIVENMNKAEQLDGLLSEVGASSVAELKQLIRGQKSQLLSITHDILASLGIASEEDWKRAIRDKALAAMFSHESVPTVEMFNIAQGYIRRAKETIIAHLRTLPNYDMTDVEETAPTVLGGIIKDGREIHVVARPAYSGQVIIHYSAERDVLDFEDSELWADTGAAQLRVTFGHILKTTKISKFPI